MNKRLIGFILLMLLLMLPGCTASQQVESRFRERVLPNTLGSSSALDKFGIRYFDEGAIVLFTGDDPQQAGYSMMGYAVFRQDLGTWHEGQIGSSTRLAEDLTGKLIDYALSDFNFQGKGRDLTFDYRLLAGEILSPTAESIEAVLDDGTVLQDEGEDDVFAFRVEVAPSFCQLRVLDAQGNVLETLVPEYEAGPHPTPGPEC
ncbi:MAG: hypothetical protein IT327_03840 [Anaerolineae bacterium]|nr:hypothetical protein [Anaerolineae bacterium]